MRSVEVTNSIAKCALTVLLLIASLASGNVDAREKAPAYADEASSSALDSVSLGELPPQARITHQLIRQGGPFPFQKDGVVFGNRERLLPRKTRGFYREYTVKAAGSHDRGVQRMICGGPATRPEVCFYTADHYASFRRIEP